MSTQLLNAERPLAFRLSYAVHVEVQRMEELGTPQSDGTRYESSTPYHQHFVPSHDESRRCPTHQGGTRHLRGGVRRWEPRSDEQPRKYRSRTKVNWGSPSSDTSAEPKQDTQWPLSPTARSSTRPEMPRSPSPGGNEVLNQETLRQ